MGSFTHLHVHTQYSLLDGAASVERLLAKAKEQGMTALAMTDHGNMFGICHFIEAARKFRIKPIIGCEFYVAHDRFDRTNKTRYHQILLAKNELGYKNLSILSSLSFIDGYYYKPRIDKEILRQYHSGIIATTACMTSQISQALLTKGEDEAEKYFKEMYDIFGEDYYLEVQRFNNDDQERYNQFLLKLSRKYGVKVVATNDVHYVNQEESVAHDVLLCIQTNSDYNDPNRMRFCSDTFYLKSTEQMLDAFRDIPEVVYNTQEVVDKCWDPHLERDILLPQYEVPDDFVSQSKYLEHLTWSGAKRRLKVVTAEHEGRLRYELEMIHKMRFEGYFLIVQDYINAAREMNVSVGPGRGSVAGSLVAYCLGITDINPLKYGLFFERFLNPERISMPDIDVDFEDNGREKVIDYVVSKYGRDHVAHLVTFGTMAAKVAVKDVARVFGMPFEKSNQLTKLIPSKTTGTLFEMVQTVPELKTVYDQEDSLEHKILSIASVLEGCKRQTGLHACGMIIAPEKLMNFLPVKTDKNTNLLVTQYEGGLVEHIGMLKMDFLGLKTLTIIKNTLKFIKQHQCIDVNINEIDLNDRKTLDIFGNGDTVGVFQFESSGMRQWLVRLKPDSIDDIIAMNALYRPGPMQFIPDFIDRKHGEKAIEYPHQLLEDILKSTYGIIVYQEQVMQVAQVIAGYSLGQADILRKAMGKKKPEEMAKQKTIFIRGCMETHGMGEVDSTAIFEMMETFAQYGFNKAHAAAYSIIAFQTAYLKAHYPVEFMTASLINAQSDITGLTPLMQECQRMGIKLHGPSVNESNYDFDINNRHEIYYGLAGIKGVGDAAARNIITSREKHGKFKDIFDFAESIELRTMNKKTFESLALSGAFDCLCSGNRRQYVYVDGDMSFIERLISYGGRIISEREEMKSSLFGEDDLAISALEKPEMPQCMEYPQIDLLNFEKEFVGFYISGNPLDDYKECIENVCNANSLMFNRRQDNEVEDNVTSNKVRLAGIITRCIVRMTKNNTQYGIITIEDFYGEMTFNLFGQTFAKHKDLLRLGEGVFCVGEVTQKYNDVEKLEFKCDIVMKLSDVSRRYDLTKTIS